MILFDKPFSTLFDCTWRLETKQISLAAPDIRVKVNSLVFIFGLCLLSGFEAAIAQEQGSLTRQHSVKNEELTISLQGNRLRIEARQVPWRQLLNKLMEQTRIPVHSALPLDAKVTVSIDAPSITDALQQLFNHRFDYVLLFSRQGINQLVAPKAVWLLGKSSDKAADNAVPAAENIENKTTQGLLDKARNEINPELRLQALASLNGLDEPEKTGAKQALMTALDDNDARVREYAVQALASQNGDEATELLREALVDPDAGVRIKAVESFALEGQGIALLQEALSNPDELVQTIAEERLKQVKP